MKGIIDKEQAKKAVSSLLEFFHVPDSDGIYTETPERFLNALYEIVGGQGVAAPSLRTFETKSSSDIVFFGPLKSTSLCPHHLFPYLVEAFFAYTPGERVVGISKPGRLLQWVCSRTGLQEEMGGAFLDEFEKQVPNKGAMLLLKGWHLCASIRGAKQSEAETITIDTRGVFHTQHAQDRFISLVKLARGAA